MLPSTSRMTKKRDRASVDTAVVDIFRREVGNLSTRKFAHRLAASEDLVLRLDLLRKLEKHRGCVNTVSFNADGDILVSGSDDRKVILWEWETGRVKLSFQSGHNNNIFQAKIMPDSDDRSIVTCAADGQVRHAKILERGEVDTKLLGKHQGRAHKLANEPGSPYVFYTCGEDGLVQHFDLRTGVATKLLTCQPVPVCTTIMIQVVNLNAIAIDPRNPHLFAIAGSDEFARLYDIRRYRWLGSSSFGSPVDYFCPRGLIGDKNVGITGLAFSDQSELLVSYGDESIYLFSKDMGLGSNINRVVRDHADSKMGVMDAKGDPQCYKGHRNCVTVKGVNFFGPKCEYVVSGSDCGRMFMWRKNDTKLIHVVEADNQVVNCIEAHPHTPMLASSGMDRDIKIWTPRAIEKATLPTNIDKVPVSRRFRYFPFAGFDDDDDDDDSGDEYYSNEYDDDDEDDDSSSEYSDTEEDDGDDEGDEEERDFDLYEFVDVEHIHEDPHHDGDNDDDRHFESASNDDEHDDDDDFGDEE